MWSTVNRMQWSVPFLLEPPPLHHTLTACSQQIRAQTAPIFC
jgi:hypothetical protein